MYNRPENNQILMEAYGDKITEGRRDIEKINEKRFIRVMLSRRQFGLWGSFFKI